jgi:hypothetical protein
MPFDGAEPKLDSAHPIPEHAHLLVDPVQVPKHQVPWFLRRDHIPPNLLKA